MPKYGIFDFIWGYKVEILLTFLHKVHQENQSVATISFTVKLQKSLEPNFAQFLTLNPFKSEINWLNISLRTDNATEDRQRQIQELQQQPRCRSRQRQEEIETWSNVAAANGGAELEERWKGIK